MIIGETMTGPRAGRRMTMIVCAWTLSTLCASIVAPDLARAQPAPEVYAGYSYLNDPSNSVLQVTDSDSGLPAGWLIGVAWPMRIVPDWLSLVGEAGGNYKTRTTLDADVSLSFHAYMGGARAAARVGRLTEFGQVLVGVAHGSGSAFGATASSSGFAVQPGGGLDYPLRRHLLGRIELD